MSDTTREGSIVVAIKKEINSQLADKETMDSLLSTTFTGFEPALMKRALLEGMLRGFSFKEFLNRDVYAIPYGNTYSLVTSIDHARKIGARSGIVGVKKPEYVIEGGKILSCSITVLKRFPDGYVGEFEAEVDFKEYATGKNLWASKPKTMIAKVAEMHALRKACPEALAEMYAAEEFEQREAPIQKVAIDLDVHSDALTACTTLEELERVWADVPGDAKGALKTQMEGVKAMLTKEVDETIA